jgi:hypothetical protein
MSDTDARLDVLFDRLARMRDDELASLSAREERSPEERRGAREAARSTLSDTGRSDLAVAEEMLRAWATSVAGAIPAGVHGTAGNAGQLEARQRALPIVGDAVLAILAGDRLEPEHREVLTDSVLAQHVGID